MSLFDICQNISKFIKDLDKKGLEVEVKLRGVTEDEYSYLMDYLKRLYKYTEETTTDFYINGDRFTLKDKKIYQTSKKNITEPFYKKYKDRNLKFTVSREENKLTEKKSLRKYDFSRKKERSSFIVGNFSIDLTKVTRDDDQNYEIEIEIVNPDIYDPSGFRNIISEYVELIKMEDINIVSFCNYSLSGGQSVNDKEIQRKYVSRPRNLIKADVTTPNSILKGFTVSIKADGVQKFLVLFKGYIYLIDTKNPEEKICPLPEEFKSLDNTIYAGELIPRNLLKKENSTDFMNIFLPFDTICYKGEIVKDKSYLDRFELIKNINGLEIFCNGVKKIKVMEKKIFNLGKESRTFYENFEKCYQEKKNIIYEDDGYIFTPIDSPYLTEGQRQQFKKEPRILSKFYDVCKFKPLEKSSIDFLVKDGKIYAFNIFKKKLVEFEKIKFTLEFKEDIDDKIVEFFPDFSGEEVKLRPFRIREDKEYPNSIDVADEISKSYKENNPITEDTLRGKDTVLMRNFNNFFVKRKLINDLEGYIVDIGAGAGGDIPKFNSNRKIKKILSIEPNKEFSKQFSKRLDIYNARSKFKLLEETKGEDTNKIVEGMNFFPKNMKDEKLNITFMISLSFFWSSFEKLQELANTINSINKEYKRRGGNSEVKISFYTINGYHVEKYFEKIGKNTVNLNTIFIKFNGVNEVEVDISDSKTVSDQTEYLVKINDLLPLIGGELLENRTPKVFNILMSKAELTYINMFSYGSIVVKSQVELIYPEPRIEIDEENGIDIDGKILASGEDTLKKIPHLGENIFRVGTLDLEKSLTHSILKLVNVKYRNSDIYQRIEMSEQFQKFDSLEDLANILDAKINVYFSEEVKSYNKTGSKTLNLYKCKDMTFEPIVKILGENVMYYFQ